ncbi:thioesterase family protein [Oceanobacillus salinisoli]|uniref:thioesterase family protein n=1 Tax=Oceanobacillus salinisoli TaxID=2678611 RepID=UPI0012E2F54D|nr:thioesterase family protein [Oceanobacillus salinisoli]
MESSSFQYECIVKKNWVDYNCHMNDAEYAKVFSLALDQWIEEIGLDQNARNDYGYTIFTLETHLCYLQEVHEGQNLNVSLQLLDNDEKRIHVIFLMKNDENKVVATSEQMLMGIDTQTNRPAPFPDVIAKNIDELNENQKEMEAPKQAGRRIGIKR